MYQVKNLGHPTHATMKEGWMFRAAVIGLVLLCIAWVVIFHGVTWEPAMLEGFDMMAKGDKAVFRSEKDYKAAVKVLEDRYVPFSSAKRPVTASPALAQMPESQQSLVNFYALGCRTTGFVGPAENGYFDAEIGVQMAVKAGCRVFVLEIDYFDECRDDAVRYFPRLVTRDIQGKQQYKKESNLPFCNSAAADGGSNIREVCKAIQQYAFSADTQNATDPVIVVLYFLRQPPGSYKSKEVLDYYSHVAQMLAPLRDRFLGNELDGGTFHRQRQESRLLMNPITAYAGKVLVFSNANTVGFRETDNGIVYDAENDLDYVTNLRLTYSQTKLGITGNDLSTFGLLQTAEDFMTVPADRNDSVVEQTKMRWTICLPKDPSKDVTADMFQAIVTKYGVHCVPTNLFDPGNTYLFTEGTFKTYSYQPKPEPLRYIKPPVITPGEPNPSTNANQGKLRAPVLG